MLIPETPFAPSAPAPQVVRPAVLSRQFRQRLLFALGSVLVAGVGCTDGRRSGDKEDTWHHHCSHDHHCSHEPYTRTSQETLLAEADGSCAESPDPAHFEGSINHYLYLKNCRDVVLVASTAELCTYAVTCDVLTCCYGRPYIDAAGRPLLSSTVAREDWRRPVAVEVDGLDPEDRAQLAAFWLHNAAAEHSSVAGFHRFALDLLAHGAPPELIALAQRAAAQEAEHALTCFSLASVYAGHGLGPAPMPLGERAPVASSLAQLAVWTLRDGAIGETIAAYGVAAALERTADPETRRLLTKIAAEELHHAELAWKTLRWALDTGGDPVLQALRATYQSLDLPDEPDERSTTATVARGILPPEDRNRAVRRCVQEVIGPVFASLMATRLAA